MSARKGADSGTAARIVELLPGARVRDDGSSVRLPSNELEQSLRLLRDDPELGFRMLIDLTAFDRRPRKPRFRVSYQLCEPTRGARLRVDVEVAAGDARLPTCSGLWPAADWLEREVFDLYGIVFAGHPDLRRILLDDDFEGHPLRKDFLLESAGRGRDGS